MEAQLLTLSTNIILIAIMWKLYDIHKFLSNERKSVRKHEQTQEDVHVNYIICDNCGCWRKPNIQVCPDCGHI